MAYVTITKDLTEVKDKVAFGLTRRQIICFFLGGLLGAGGYFLTRHALGNDAALLLLIALAAPFMTGCTGKSLPKQRTAFPRIQGGFMKQSCRNWWKW